MKLNEGIHRPFHKNQVLISDNYHQTNRPFHEIFGHFPLEFIYIAPIQVYGIDIAIEIVHAEFYFSGAYLNLCIL